MIAKGATCHPLLQVIPIPPIEFVAVPMEQPAPGVLLLKVTVAPKPIIETLHFLPT